MGTKFMQLPRAVLVGENTTDNILELIDELKLEGDIILVADPTTYKIAGEKIEKLLKSRKVRVETVQNARMESVKQIESVIGESGNGFAIAVGGGAVIDVVKLACKNRGVEYISVPTAAAHDGIASARASIKAEGGTVSKGANAPIGVLADTSIIKDAPFRLLASGCGDIISKYTSVKDWELARDKKGENFSEYASALSMMSAKIVMDSPSEIQQGSEKSAKKVIKALISCGVAMSIAGSSRPASGSEHKFSHALDMISKKPALHGEQCGVGSIMMMKLHGGDWRKIRDSLATIGAPTTADKLRVSSEEVVRALLKASEIRPERYTILDEARLSEKEAKQLARETEVIG